MLVFRNPVNRVCSVMLQKLLLVHPSISRVIAAGRPVEFPVALPRTGDVLTVELLDTLARTAQLLATATQIPGFSLLVNLIQTNKCVTYYETTR